MQKAHISYSTKLFIETTEYQSPRKDMASQAKDRLAGSCPRERIWRYIKTCIPSFGQLSLSQEMSTYLHLKKKKKS